MDKILDASYYRMNSAIYRISAEVLVANFLSKKERIPGNLRAIPLYNMMFHSIELLLKCALIKRGVSLTELKKQYFRHNLKNMLIKLMDFGLPVSQKTVNSIKLLSDQHEQHRLRYTAICDDGKATYTPEPDDLFEIMDELMSLTAISTHGR